MNDLVAAMPRHVRPFGGPLRSRVPRRLGYTSVKFVNRLVLTHPLDEFGSGTGQSSANDGYASYAGT